MNETASPTPPRQPGGSDRFFTWLRGLGIVRSDDRWLAGVASGIAAKSAIDPIIVRGVFVVLAVLGGPGILLYIAAWLLLPDSAGRIHLEQIFRGQASAATVTAAVIVGAVVVIPLVFWTLRSIFSGPLGWGFADFLPDWVQVTFGVIWWAVIVPGAAIWLVIWFSTRAKQRAQTADDSAPKAHTFVDRTEQVADSASQKAEEWGTQFSHKAEQWGQKAEQKTREWSQKADEKTREWEQWGRDYQERHRLGAGFVSISLAIALIVGGLAAAAAFAITTDSHVTIVLGLIFAVTVLAVSMIVAGIRGRDSGWVGFLAFCGVVALIFAPFSSLLPKHTDFIPFGNTQMYVAQNDEDRASLMIAGNTTIDLGDLTQHSDARVIDVWLLGGNVTVRLSESHPTRVHVSLLAGNIRDNRDERFDEPERRYNGLFVSRDFDQQIARSSTVATTVNIRLAGGNVYLEEVTEEGRSAAERARQTQQDEELREREIEQLQRQIKELEQAS